MNTEPKPLAKSLHTVTVLVRTAKLIAARDCALGLPYPVKWKPCVEAALVALDLQDKPDTYGLAAIATKQLEKGA